jgi:hypothetical protein
MVIIPLCPAVSTENQAGDCPHRTAETLYRSVQDGVLRTQRKKENGPTRRSLRLLRGRGRSGTPGVRSKSIICAHQACYAPSAHSPHLGGGPCEAPLDIRRPRNGDCERRGPNAAPYPKAVASSAHCASGALKPLRDWLEASRTDVHMQRVIDRVILCHASPHGVGHP